MPDLGQHITDFEGGIAAVDTGYMRPLLDASHLLVSNGRAAFVDTGCNDSVPRLLAALEHKNLAPEQVDYVFLTHVHLDHAGGAGLLLQSLPNARAVLHPRGAPHMADPSRLVKGSMAVYGEAAFRDLYGEVRPIPETRIDVVEDGQQLLLGDRSFRCMFTEGHARHHYCLVDPATRSVFTGDSFGISYREFDTAAGAFIYPTTTPVHFDPDEAHRSIDRIMAEEPAQVFLTHYSRVDDLPRLADDMHRGISEFVALALAHANAADRSAALRLAMFRYLKGRLDEHGFRAEDERLHELLDIDIDLNSMGLEHWLDHAR